MDFLTRISGSCCLFIIFTIVKELIADSDFQPIIGPTNVALSTLPPLKPSLPPSALPLIQSKPKYSSKERPGHASSYEDNIFMESKRYAPTVVRYTKRRDAPAPAPKRPIKRHHTHSYSRPRRRPKPIYGPPGYTYGAPLNEFSLAGDIYDPSIFSPPVSKRPIIEKTPPPAGVVDTDIGKFYDSAPTFNTKGFKSSYKPFGTSLLSPTSLFGGTNDFKLGEANPILTNSDSSPSGTYPPSGSYSPPSSGSYSPPLSDSYSPPSAGSYSPPSAGSYSPPSEGSYSPPSAGSYLPPSEGSYSPPSAGSYSPPSAGSYSPPSADSYSPPSPGPYAPSSSQFDTTNFNLYDAQPPTIYPIAPQQSQPNLVPSHVQPQLSLSSIPQLMSTFGERERPTKPNKKPLPPSTSYGVPVAPVLSSYAIDSSRNSYQIPLQNPAKGIPATSSGSITTEFGSQNSYLPPLQGSRANSHGNTPTSNLAGSSSNRAPQGHFAEPPGNGEQQRYPTAINQPKSPQIETAISPYDAPFQFQQQSKIRTSSTNIQAVATPQNVNANEVPDYEDDQLESSTNTDTFAQPVLPNSYDQEEFEAFAKQKRKILRQQQKDFKKFQEFTSFFDSAEESVRPPKKPKKKPQATSETDDFDDAPDDDYLDEIVGRPTKRPIRIRKKRPRTTTTPHVLDTDDLRDAFSSGSVKYSMAVKPDDMGTPIQPFGNRKKTLKPTRVSTQQQKIQRKAAQIPEIPSVQSQNENRTVTRNKPNQYSSDNANQFNIISIQKSHSQTLYDGQQSLPTWNPASTKIAQIGIQSRYDNQNNFDLGDAVGRPQSQPPKLSNHNYNLNHHLGNHKYDGDTDRSDVFDQSEAQADDAIGTVEEEHTSKIVTNPPTVGTTLWDGKTMPKNHKMA